MRRPLVPPTLALLATIVVIVALGIAAASIGIDTIVALMPVTGLHNLRSW